MYTTQQVCEKTGLSFWTLYNAIRTNRIKPYLKLGRAFIWNDADVQKVREYFADKGADVR